MQKPSRVLVLVSLVLAAGAYLVSISVHSPRFAWLAVVGAVLAAAGARLVPAATGAVLLGGVFVAPGILCLAFSRPETEFHSMWLVPMAAYLVAGRPVADWCIPSRWRWPIVVWALVVAVCWPIVFLRELDFAPSMALLSEAYSNGLAPDRIWLWTTSVAVPAMSFMVGVLWFDSLFDRAGAEAGEWWLRRRVVAPIAIGVAATSAAGLYQAWVDPSWLSYGVWIELKRATGALLDGNALGMVAATWFPVLAGFAASRRHERRRSAAAAGAVLLLGWLVVFASGSRTAFAAILVGTLFLAAGLAAAARVRRWKLVVVAGLAAASVVVVLGAAAASGRLRTATPLHRIAQSLPPPTADGLVRLARSMWLRDGWGQAAGAIIAERPFTGVGIGSFSRQSVDYYQRQTGVVLPPDNAQNWWRQQAAELGIAGAILAVILSLLTFRMLCRPAPAGSTVLAGALRGAIGGLGVASLFGVPTQLPVVAFCAWTLLFLAVRLFEGQARDAAPAPRFAGRIAVIGAGVLVALVAAGQLYAATHDLRPPMRVMRVGGSYGYGFWRGGVDAEGRPFWWTGRRAVFVFPLEPGVLEITATPMHPDIASQPVHVEIAFDGRTVLEQVVHDRSPVKIRLPARPGQRAAFIETRVDRTFGGPGGEQRALLVQKTYDRPAPAR
jgi:hypothetical protein